MAVNEEEFRRPDFVPGAPVQLADGGTWFFRRPVLRFVPDDTTESGFQIKLILVGDDEFSALIAKRDAMFGSDGTGSASYVDLIPIEFKLARMMLLANYNLTSDQLGSLLQFGISEEDDPEGYGIRQAVIGVALGRGGKPSPDGTEP